MSINEGINEISEFYKNVKLQTVTIEIKARGFCAMPLPELRELLVLLESKAALEIWDKGNVAQSIESNELKTIEIEYYDSVIILPHEIYIKGEHGGRMVIIDFKTLDGIKKILDKNPIEKYF